MSSGRAHSHRNRCRVVGNLFESCLKSKRSACPWENHMLCPNRCVISSKALQRESVLYTWILQDRGGNPSSTLASHVDMFEFPSVIFTALNQHQKLCSPGIVRAEPGCVKAELNARTYRSGKGQADLEMRCPGIVRDYPPPGPSPGSYDDDSRRLFGFSFFCFLRMSAPGRSSRPCLILKLWMTKAEATKAAAYHAGSESQSKVQAPDKTYIYFPAE